jgi:hypothetical protein
LRNSVSHYTIDTKKSGEPADQITSDEISELDAIGELDRIFTHINAMLAAQNVN